MIMFDSIELNQPIQPTPQPSSFSFKMTVLITAGPTHEPIDAVRYIGNRSSGKMGYAIARAARDLGHKVILISGPVTLNPPSNITVHHVQTAKAMYQRVADTLKEHPINLAILTAAVADFTPSHPAKDKLKKNQLGSHWSLELERTPDILGSMRSPLGFQGTLVGFAAETSNLATNAWEKLTAKHCDFIVANDVSNPDIGFANDNNAVLVLEKSGNQSSFKSQPKSQLATQLLQLFLNPPPQS